MWERYLENELTNEERESVSREVQSVAQEMARMADRVRGVWDRLTTEYPVLTEVGDLETTERDVWRAAMTLTDLRDQLHLVRREVFKADLETCDYCEKLTTEKRNEFEEVCCPNCAEEQRAEVRRLLGGQAAA